MVKVDVVMEKPTPAKSRFPWGFVPNLVFTEENEDNKGVKNNSSFSLLASVQAQFWFAPGRIIRTTPSTSLTS
jgi:hypothetical protein